jgi:hypothetical protein
MNLWLPGEYIFILIVLIIGPLQFSVPVFGTDRSQINIPTLEEKILFDGNVEENRWSNSYRVSFPEAGFEGQNVTVYLHYEPNEKALIGAFVIPDDSPADNKREFDAIRFIFDVSASTQSVVHDIALYRYGEIIYRIENEMKSKSNVSPLNLQPPFERIEFKTNSDANRWTGQFRIYFSTEPTIYKFVIQQQNDWTGKQGNVSLYPSPDINLADPSTWGNILFRSEVSEVTSAPTPTPEPNNRPKAFDMDVETKDNAPIGFALNGTDEDELDVLNFTIETKPVYGEISSFSPRGSVGYRPFSPGEVLYEENNQTLSDVGYDAFMFIVSDNKGSVSNPATVTIRSILVNATTDAQQGGDATGGEATATTGGFNCIVAYACTITQAPRGGDAIGGAATGGSTTGPGAVGGAATGGSATAENGNTTSNSSASPFD